jgi:site-specific DNA recombinase
MESYIGPPALSLSKGAAIHDVARSNWYKKVRGNRAAAYIRVSDESQVQGYSLDAQRVEIARWCERNGYELVLVYADEGVSAHTDKIEKRPQLVRLLEDARQGKFDIVVVHTLDLWARNIGVQRLALSKLGDYDIGFTSATEDFDYSSPNGSFLLTMLGGAAELFSDQLAVHVRKSQRQRAELGLPLGHVPFGYRTPEPGRVPQLEPREAAAVREVYKRRAEGESTGSLATWLNNQGFKTLKGGIFTAHAVKDMLNCRFHLGKVSYNTEEYPGQHEAIITEELFQRVQARKVKRAITRTVAGPKGLLQGMVACGQCGKGVQSDRHRYGGAMYRERHSHQCTTNGRSIMAQRVETRLRQFWPRCNCYRSGVQRWHAWR